jgi:hypothetical protein
MLNKIIIAKYLKDNDQDGFYSDMMSDVNSVNPLSSEEKKILFSNTEDTLRQLDYFTDLGYFEKSSKLFNCIRYTYDLYYFYPLLSSKGKFLLPGNVFTATEVCIISEENVDEVIKDLTEFKSNVKSGLYPNILDFNFVTKDKYYSDVYEVRDKYFDSLFFFGDSITDLHTCIPLNFPHEGRETKKWATETRLDDISLENKNEIDISIEQLEWKKDRIGLIIRNSKAYWLYNNGREINFHDQIAKYQYGITNYLVPGFSSLENYLSRIFEDAVAYFLQEKYGYFTKIRNKPPYLGGKEIDVFGKNTNVDISYLICECKFRLRKNPITVEEISDFVDKTTIIKNQIDITNNETIKFWLVTNSEIIPVDCLTHAEKNNIKVMRAKLNSKWQRRSDWSVTEMKEVVKDIKSP